MGPGLFSIMGFGRAVLVALCVSLAACGSDAPTAPTPSPAPAPSPVPAPSPTPPPAAAPPFTLSGRVTDLNTGAPLAVTSVTIIDGTDTGRTTTTDAAGAFQLADLGLGGRTVRFRHEGYDSVFRGVTLVSDTSVSIGMRPAMQSLAGTWTGSLTVTMSNTPNPQTTSIPELNITHTGADISGVYPNTVVLLRNAPQSVGNRGHDRGHGNTGAHRVSRRPFDHHLHRQGRDVGYRQLDPPRCRRATGAVRLRIHLHERDGGVAAATIAAGRPPDT